MILLKKQQLHSISKCFPVDIVKFFKINYLQNNNNELLVQSVNFESVQHVARVFITNLGTLLYDRLVLEIKKKNSFGKPK